jgi:hypothetical protein
MILLIFLQCYGYTNRMLVKRLFLANFRWAVMPNANAKIGKLTFEDWTSYASPVRVPS